MSTSAAPRQGYALAYDEARRTLDEQERAVAELRTRAGALIATAAITTSFFGGPILGDGGLGIAAWIAIAAFAGLGVAVLAVLWPGRDWTFLVSAEDLISDYLEPPDAEPLPLHAIHRDLALHMSRSVADNRRQLRAIVMGVRVGVALLAVETVAWVVALITHY